VRAENPAALEHTDLSGQETPLEQQRGIGHFIYWLQRRRYLLILNTK
jgi:hypothetical protein